MTDKEKLKEIEKLADAMYYAAQYLTADASRLHKAMDEYHQFIINEWREEPVSRDYREIYKNITQSDAFKSAYENKSLGEVMSVEGEEPVSEDLEEDAMLYAKREYDKKNPATLPQRCIGCYAPLMYAFKAGAKWQKEHLWKPADGDDFPEIGREVVAFQADVLNLLKIVVAHRPNPEGYDFKSIITGEVEHYTPKIYGKGNWNIPNVKWWLDVKLPKEIEL